LEDVAVFGGYMAKLRPLLKRLASMAARRSWELTGWQAAMVGRLRAFWEAWALPAPVRGEVGAAGVGGPRGALRQRDVGEELASGEI